MSDSTPQNTKKTYKKVHAIYHTSSTFIIPDDVTDFYIHWDTLYYTGKEGKQHKVEPLYSAEHDTDFMKRPVETEEEEANESEQEGASEYDSCEEEKDSDTEEKPAVQSKGPN